MKKVGILSCIVMLLFSLTGCKPYLKARTEIDSLTFVKVIGLDLGKKETIRVTAASRNISLQTGSATTQTSKAKNLTIEGKTLFEAVRKLSLFSEKQPFFGHTEFILIGEDLAKKEGVLPSIDFLTRDHELRLNSRVYVVKGMTAQEFLEKSALGEYFISDRLFHLEEGDGKMSTSTNVTLAETMFILESPFLSLYLPTVEMKKSLQKTKQNKIDLFMEGYALFKKDKLQRYINEDEARGLNWLRNLTESGIIVVKDKSGENISLEIISSKTIVKPTIKRNGQLKAIIEIKLETNIGEIYGQRNVFTKSDIDYLKKRQEEAVKKVIMKNIQIAKENEIDYFSLGTQFYQKYPKEWPRYEKKWSKELPNIETVVKINSNILRTYQLNQPTRVGGPGK